MYIKQTQTLAASVESRVCCSVLLAMESGFLAEIHIPEHHSIPPSEMEEETRCLRVRKGLAVKAMQLIAFWAIIMFCFGHLKISFPVLHDVTAGTVSACSSSDRLGRTAMLHLRCAMGRVRREEARGSG